MITQLLEALRAADDWIANAPHGENCFLHDSGEHARCYCGKDSLQDFLTANLDQSEQALAEVNGLRRYAVTTSYGWRDIGRVTWGEYVKLADVRNLLGLAAPTLPAAQIPKE